ncbi:MAG: DNA repair protein RecN [Clostridia bacterium]|nr:DNA repair protein RecN [Clostridia bacterium]
MLKSLHIENIAVIEKTDIDFIDGFNVLTGETGAGKSIIIDAINAVLGERTSKELIRTGSAAATVSALFCSLSEYAVNALSDCGYSLDGGNLLITRTLTHSGSAFKINGQPATAGILKTIGKFLINIHGQHDNQSLLNADTHYLYIDRLANNSEALDNYYKEYHHLNLVRKELASYEIDEAQKRRDTELLEYQIKELTDASLTLGESEDLKRKLDIIQNREKNREALQNAYSYINGDEQSDGAFSAVRNAQKEISNLKLDGCENISEKFSEVIMLLDDAAALVRGALKEEEIGFDAETVRNRLDTIYKITMKYGGSEESALAFLNDAQEKLNRIKLSDKKIIELSNELDKSTERLIELGDKLSASRRAAAEKFRNDVTSVLTFLDMPQVEFEVSINKSRYTKTGADDIEFLISTNPGEPPKPLAKIASGGELSRVMLAIKSVLADKDDVDTLIFDEIDSGISGRAAQKVGQQLKQVSAARQTLCVTHLAQIAAFAQNHLLIEKSVRENSTYTAVKQLSGDERVMEIARIMAGSNISENIINSARELLERNF